MHRLLFHILILLAITPVDLFAASTMLRMNRLDSNDLTQIFIAFDQLPEYSHYVVGKRIDLMLGQTVEADDFSFISTDDTIVKHLLDRQDNTTVLSFFLRYPPQKVNLEASSENQLVLEIVTGNEYSETYRDFSQKFGGLSVVRDERMDYTNPIATSEYASDWPSFYERFEPELSISAPLLYTLPAFPILSQFPSLQEIDNLPFTSDILEMGSTGSWSNMQAALLTQTTAETDLEKKKQLALTYGEALLRDGNWVDAYKQFYLLAENYPDELIGFWAKYLIIYTTAIYDDPFLAAIQAKEYAAIIPDTSNLASYIHLLRIETALATGEIETLRQLLVTKDIAIPDTLYPIVEMRQADFLYTIKRYVPAHVTYQGVAPEILQSHPYSLAGNCDTLFRLKKYGLAAMCYQQLEAAVPDLDNRALVAYRNAVSTLKNDEENRDLTSLFAIVEDTYQGSEGSYRAAVKKNDHRLQLNNTWLEQATKYYRALAENAIWKDVREECYFKEALTWYLLEKPEESLPILKKLQREFRTGKLRGETEALLLTILPGELKKYIDDKQYLKALTLAKQHKDYFARGWIKSDIFPDIADAYLQSNLNQEAEKAFLYLYDIAEDEKKEDYFLPLIQSIFDQGKYYMVDDYASQYAYLYPDGKHKEDVLNLRLQALTIMGRYDKAMTLLPEPLPDDPGIMIFAASIAYYSDNFGEAVKILSPMDPKTLGEKELFILADSAFKSGNNEQAKTLFTDLLSKKYRTEQSMYRLAEIAKTEGDTKTSREYLEKIIDGGNESLWSRYAERELKFMELAESIETTLNNS